MSNLPKFNTIANDINKKSVLNRISNKSNSLKSSNNITDKSSRIVGNNIIFSSNNINKNKSDKICDDYFNNIFGKNFENKQNDMIPNKNSNNLIEDHSMSSNDKFEKLISHLKNEIKLLQKKNFEKDKLLFEKDKRIRELYERNKKLENEVTILNKKRREKCEKMENEEKENSNKVKKDEDQEIALALATFEEMERRQSGQLNNRRLNVGNPINFHPSDVLDVQYLVNDPILEQILGNINLNAEIDPYDEYENHLINEICPNPDNMTYEQLLDLGEKVGTVSKGFNKKEIEKIPSVKFSKLHFKVSDKCTICLFDFNENDNIRKLTCGHLYHKQCVDEWFTNEKVCPVCKKEVKIR